MSDNNNNNEYEPFCYMCRRMESVCGRMLNLPGGMHLCLDCAQKTFDMIGSGQSMIPGLDLSGLGFDFSGMPYMQPDAGAPSSSEEKDEIQKLAEKAAKYTDFREVTGDISEGEEVATEEPESDKQAPTGLPPFLGGGGPGRGGISFINLADLQGLQGHKKVKKKDPKRTTPLINLKDVPPPHKIKEQLDEYVIGQEQAKKVISVAVYNHYKRVATSTQNSIEIEKSNMLMIGPTGSGKTYLVKTLARLLNVPLAIADATSLTEAGYIGDDIESVLSKLLAAADNDVEKAEMGIVFIDEIDKLAKKRNTNSRDVSGESVQQGLLKLLEGSDVEVPVGASSKNAMVPLTTINTKNILFICGGAFPDLDEIIKERLNKNSAIGFYADLKDKYDEEENITKNVTLEDLRSFGMIPEFLGRLPVVFTLDKLTKDMLIQVLKEPRNAILKQYQKLLELDEVNLQFSDEALSAIAEKAMEKKTGARALRAIIEEFMLDIMFQVPRDKNIGTVTITREYIEGTGGPVIEMRGTEPLRLTDSQEN